tara:strand:- start:10209 stop:10517 length:309 start_codon:yes stop_codon:yes gene_type:complete
MKQIELRLRELAGLIHPLHALLEGSYDETTERLENVVDALDQVADALERTVKTMNEERRKISSGLEQKLEALSQQQALQMQVLTDLHAWWGGPRPQTAEQGS